MNTQKKNEKKNESFDRMIERKNGASQRVFIGRSRVANEKAAEIFIGKEPEVEIEDLDFAMF